MKFGYMQNNNSIPEFTHTYKILMAITNIGKYKLGNKQLFVMMYFLKYSKANNETVMI